MAQFVAERFNPRGVNLRGVAGRAGIEERLDFFMENPDPPGADPDGWELAAIDHVAPGLVVQLEQLSDLCRYRDYADIVAMAGLSAPDPLGFPPVSPACLSA